MSSTNTPNMSLIVPGVGSENGPEYAIEINNDLNVIDVHDHSVGRGVQITPDGMNINAALALNNNFLSGAAGLTFVPQSITPTVGTIYQSVHDLYYVNGSGLNIQITNSSGLAGTPGSISNLVAPASVNYVAGQQTFVFQSNIGIAANLDAGALVLRDLSPNSTYGVSVYPPASLALNYDLTLPMLPAQQSFMTLDTSGNMAAPWTVDDSTIKVIANKLVVQGASIPNTDREHAWELNGNYPQLTYPLTGIDSLFIAPYNLTIDSIWIYNGNAGTSGTTTYDLKIKSPGGSYSSILSTLGQITSAAASDIYTDNHSVIAPQTGVIKPVLLSPVVAAGQAIRFDLTTSMTGTATDARIRIFYTQT